MAGFVLLRGCPATTPRTPLAVFPLVFFRLSIIEQKLVLSACLVLMPRYLAGEAAGKVAIGTYHPRLRI